jgi:hypothetical protein
MTNHPASLYRYRTYGACVELPDSVDWRSAGYPEGSPLLACVELPDSVEWRSAGYPGPAVVTWRGRTFVLEPLNAYGPTPSSVYYEVEPVAVIDPAAALSERVSLGRDAAPNRFHVIDCGSSGDPVIDSFPTLDAAKAVFSGSRRTA